MNTHKFNESLPSGRCADCGKTDNEHKEGYQFDIPADALALLELNGQAMLKIGDDFYMIQELSTKAKDS